VLLQLTVVVVAPAAPAPASTCYGTVSSPDDDPTTAHAHSTVITRLDSFPFSPKRRSSSTALSRDWCCLMCTTSRSLIYWQWIP